MDDSIFFTRFYGLFSESGLTIPEFAKEAGMQYHTVRNYVRGKTVPRPKYRRQLAAALGTSVSYLFDLPEQDIDVGDGSTREEPQRGHTDDSAAEIHRNIAKRIEGIALEASSGALAVRDAWLDEGLWPVQSNLGVFCRIGCIAVLHTVTFQGDYVDLSPMKEIAALRMNLIAGRHGRPHQADCGVIVSLVVDGRALSAERMAEQMNLLGRQIDGLLEREVIIAGKVLPLYGDVARLNQALMATGTPADTLEHRLHLYFAHQSDMR